MKLSARWHAWRRRRAQIRDILDAGYRVSPQTWRHVMDDPGGDRLPGRHRRRSVTRSLMRSLWR